jgi:hypothetical protein
MTVTPLALLQINHGATLQGYGSESDALLMCRLALAWLYCNRLQRNAACTHNVAQMGSQLAG